MLKSMNLTLIKTIYFKELREVMRDKRTLFLIILLPFFMYPALFFLIGKLGQSQEEKLSTEKVAVLVNPEAANTEVVAILRQNPTLDIEPKAFDRAMLDTLKNTIGLEIPANYDELIQQQKSAPIKVYANTTKDLLDNRKDQIVAQIEQLNQQLLQNRLDGAQLEPAFIQPIAVEQVDLATKQVRLGKALGSYLPLVLLLFIFSGSIYIAIDITAGEKERRTLQTLFTAPVRIKEIIAGKFLAVFTISVTSALMNLLSLVFAVWIQVSVMGADMGGLSIAVSAGGWFWLVTLIVLSAVFLSALSMAVVLLANSYKEAQTYVSPLMMLVLIPALLVQMPGMELNTTMALIPILNICLAMGAIFQGGFSVGLVAMVTGFVLLYAILALYLASLTFGNENVITGEKVDWKTLFGKKPKVKRAQA
jgi:sodium transport system permease protein